MNRCSANVQWRQTGGAAAHALIKAAAMAILDPSLSKQGTTFRDAAIHIPVELRAFHPERGIVVRKRFFGYIPLPKRAVAHAPVAAARCRSFGMARFHLPLLSSVGIFPQAALPLKITTEPS